MSAYIRPAADDFLHFDRQRMTIFTGLLLSLFLRSAALAQNIPNPSQPSDVVYSSAVLGFRYKPPRGMQDKTGRFRLQIEEQARASGTTQTLSTLLAMSSSPDGAASNWSSVTIETYPRSAVSEPDDAKAEAKMSSWVAHSEEEGALPRSVVISGQRFTVSVFGLQEGLVKKGAVVWTTVRRRKLLSFAFVANSPQQLTTLTESMKSVQFF